MNLIKSFFFRAYLIIGRHHDIRTVGSCHQNIQIPEGVKEVGEIWISINFLEVPVFEELESHNREQENEEEEQDEDRGDFWNCPSDVAECSSYLAT